MATATAAVIPPDFEKGINQLKRDEQYCRLPYLDSRGVETIGYGFNLRDTGLSEPESSAVLHMRALTVYLEVANALPWVRQLDAARQGVLLNMAFNLGIVGELGFHITLQDVKEGRYDAAADAMLLSKWAEQVGPRAHRLAQQMRTGEWQ